MERMGWIDRMGKDGEGWRRIDKEMHLDDALVELCRNFWATDRLNPTTSLISAFAANLGDVFQIPPTFVRITH